MGMRLMLLVLLLAVSCVPGMVVCSLVAAIYRLSFFNQLGIACEAKLSISFLHSIYVLVRVVMRDEGNWCGFGCCFCAVHHLAIHTFPLAYIIRLGNINSDTGQGVCPSNSVLCVILYFNIVL